MATHSTHAILFAFTLNLLRLVCFTDSHRLYDNDCDCTAAAVEVVCVAALSELLVVHDESCKTKLPAVCSDGCNPELPATCEC